MRDISFLNYFIKQTCPKLIWFALLLQDYVSEIVSKYLPAGVSPWQMVIIPASDEQHYLLLRIHHVMINEGLNIADLLPLVPPIRHNGE